MRFLTLLITASLVSFAQDSTNALKGPRTFNFGSHPGPTFKLKSPYSDLLPESGAKPVAPFVQNKGKEAELLMAPSIEYKCGHIIIYEMRSKGLMPVIPTRKGTEDMPEVKALPVCPSDLR